VTAYILGTAQTDFARRISREGGDLSDLMSEAVRGALAAAEIDPAAVEVGHVGNFTAELFRGQGQLGGLFAAIDPALAGVPASRHEAACASGSMALLAALADLAAGFHGIACVVGVEEMRNVSGQIAASHLAAAGRAEREQTGATYFWPDQFSRIADDYDRRYGLDPAHLAAIARTNYDHARVNPLAQTRDWTFDDRAFTAHPEHNPVIEGRIRKTDCGQITDGAAALIVAGEEVASRWAAERGRPLASVARITGWGHTTAPIELAGKLAAAPDDGLAFPHIARAAAQARAQAGITVDQVDGFEVHDCFTITELILLEHLGLAEPGRGGDRVAAGDIARTGATPVNPSGGLIGCGHPVGATGVRMVADAARQVTGLAGAMQVDGARRFQTLNIGGSFTTVASFVVES
jgi:acetyl-CoA C-acetyltransferase